MQNKKYVTPLSTTPPLPFLSLFIFKFTWEIRKRLNRKKNLISDLCDFYFFELWSFLCSKWPQFSMIFTHNSNNRFGKKKLFSFSFYSAHSASVPVTIKDMQTPPPSSEIVETLWKIRNVLNRTEKIIKKILRFLFFNLSSKIGVRTSQKWP